MRILQVVNVGVEAGGAEKSVRIITEGLRARGHEVRVLATDHRFDLALPRIADEFVPAVRGGALGRLAGYFWHRRAYTQTRRLVRAFRPDCVHLHTIGEFSPSVLAATRSVPRVATVHGPEDWTLELLRWNLASAARGGALSLPDRLRYLYLRFLQRPAYLFWLRRIELILAPSEYFATAVRRDAGRVPVRLLANGIEPAAEAPAPEPDPAETETAETETAENETAEGDASPSDPAENDPAKPDRADAAHHVLYAGRLTRVKGVHVLVDAVALLQARGVRVRLSVVGDGDERAGLEAAAAGLVEAGAAEFLGWRDQAYVTGLMARSAVVVIPSLWPENFPTVALEALQAGRPLIASRVGGLPELVGPDNGALVPAGDAAALADALEQLLGDASAQAALGAGSLARAGGYAVEPFLDRITACYRELAALGREQR
jgi:glycosyltransferase involved in cell wall biosynthesis